MRNYLIFLLLFSMNVSRLNSQIDPLGDIFMGTQPIWSHVAIDSSAIGYKGRTGMDYFFTLVDSKILIDSGYAYLVYRNIFEEFSGSILEKIDLISGKSVWRNTFDLRDSTGKEFTSSFFINEQRELELLNFRNDQDTFFLLWDVGKFAIRKYNIETGSLISVFHSPSGDSLYPEFPVISPLMFSRLDKENGGGYSCHLDWVDGKYGFAMRKIYLDSQGRYVDSDTLYNQAKYKYSHAVSNPTELLNNRNDTLIRLRHSFQNQPYITGDTMELSLDLFDSNLNLIDSHNISNQVTNVTNYQIYNAKNNYICIISNEEYTDGTRPKQRIAVFNIYGELTEEIVFPSRINESFSECFGIIKLKHEPGVLIITKNTRTNPIQQINFYKTDGKGNMRLILEQPMKDFYNLVYGYLEQLENGNILLSGKFRQRNLDPNLLTTTERFITSLWDAKALGIISSTKVHPSHYLDVVISPNPATGYIQLLGLEEKPINVFVYNEFGDLVLKKKVQETSKHLIALDGLESGAYFVQLFDDKDELLYCGKIVKVNSN